MRASPSLFFVNFVSLLFLPVNRPENTHQQVIRMTFEWHLNGVEIAFENRSNTKKNL